MVLQQQIVALQASAAAAWAELARLEAAGAGAVAIGRQHWALVQADVLLAELEAQLAIARAADLLAALQPRALIW